MVNRISTVQRSIFIQKPKNCLIFIFPVFLNITGRASDRGRKNSGQQDHEMIQEKSTMSGIMGAETVGPGK